MTSRRRAEKLPLRIVCYSLLGIARGRPVGSMRGGGGRPASECADSDKRCAEWAGVGECDKNPGFMRSQCQHSCGSCGWVNPHCAGHVAAAKQTGGIDAMFEAAAKRPELRATVHSRPPHGPWVMTFDRFISEAEADAFIDTTADHFERSLAGAFRDSSETLPRLFRTTSETPPLPPPPRRPSRRRRRLSRPVLDCVLDTSRTSPPPGDVVSPVRTSKQAWCQPGLSDACYRHPLIRRVHERVVNVTGVPAENAEFYQVKTLSAGWAASRCSRHVHDTSMTCP